MKRLRISLRLMFILTALFAVIFAWRGAVRQRELLDTRRWVDILEYDRTYYLNKLNNPTINPADAALYRKELQRTDSELKLRKERLGESKSPSDSN